MAQPSKKKVTAKPKPNPIKKLGIDNKKRNASDTVSRIESYYKDLEKSKFIKVTKRGYLDDTKKNAYIAPEFTVTARGNKYLKDTSNAYAKDPMKLRPKPKPMTKKKMGA
jgi:hypothetical protein